MKLSRHPKVILPIDAIGWKPRHAWVVIVGRGEGEHRKILVRTVATLTEARLEGRKLLQQGFEWGWVKEDTSVTKRLKKKASLPR